MPFDLGYDADCLHDMAEVDTRTIDAAFDMIEGLWSDMNGDQSADVGDVLCLSGRPYTLCYLRIGEA